MGILTANGHNGAMELHADHLVLRKKGWPHGTKSEKRIPLRSIGAVQWKDPGLTTGFIQIAYSGATEQRGGVFQAAKDENTVLFIKRDAPAFRAIMDQIQKSIGSPTGPAAASAADELEKLAGLRERGVITDDEFAAQKAKLLG